MSNAFFLQFVLPFEPCFGVCKTVTKRTEAVFYFILFHAMNLIQRVKKRKITSQTDLPGKPIKKEQIDLYFSLFLIPYSFCCCLYLFFILFYFCFIQTHLLCRRFSHSLYHLDFLLF